MSTQKMTVTPYVELTGRMSGTTCTWPWQVSAVYVNGVSNAFTWVDGLLTVTGYTSGIVLADFTLHLLYDEVSSYMPSDPTNPLSTPVFWENRLTSFFAVSSSIKSFETGLTEVSAGNIGIRIDDDWLDLITELVIFSNRTIRVYTDDVISYKGITTKMDIADYVMTVQIQKRQTILDSELHWGDAAHLCRIDRSSNTAFYNGANIPAEFEGFAIPFFFGDQLPYEYEPDGGEADLGTALPNFLVPPGNKRAARGINTSSFIARVIPTSASTGIIGRMPSWQSISSVAINQTLTSSQHFWTKAAQANNSVILNKMIIGEVCSFVSAGFINSGRLYNRDASNGYFVLGADDPNATDDMADPANFVAYTTINGCDENIHFIPSAIPKTSWTGGSVLSGTFTGGGHRWLTVSSIGGMDLRTDELYVVITAISGEKTAVEVMEFALEAHGYTVDSASFTALAADLPYKTIQQAGDGSSVPTLGQFVAEINRSLLTVLVFPASNDEPFIVKVDPTQAASQTIYEEQISGLRFGHEYRDQAKSVEFRPKYARSEAQQASLYRRHSASMASLFASEKSLSIDHVLAEVPGDRWEEMTEFYGSPLSTVSFSLLDDEVELELADCVQLSHPACSKKIFVTQITKQPLGRQVQGRYFHVNDNS